MIMVTPHCANVLFKSRRHLDRRCLLTYWNCINHKPLKIHSGLICGAESALVEIVGVEERQRCVETKKCEARQPRCARRRRHYRRRPTRRSRHQHRRRSRAPSSAPEPANNNPPKKKCRQRPAAAAPPSRPVQVGLRQGSLESAPASRAREGSEYGQRFFQTTNRSIGRSLEPTP